MVDLSTCIGKIVLKNPVILASGTYSPSLLSCDAGAFVTKSVTLSPCEGAPPPRIHEVEAGIINAVGLQNPGLEKFLEELNDLKKVKIPIIASIAGETIKDYCRLAECLKDKVDAIEVNISCPNKEGVFTFSKDFFLMKELISTLRNIIPITLIIKLSPIPFFVLDAVKLCKDAGVDAVCVANTLPAMAVLIKERNGFFGGLSGPAIKPIILRMVYEIKKRFDISVIGCGGIMNWEDALEYLLVGAVAVQVGTLNLVDPFAYKDIIKGLKEFLMKEGIKELSQIIGKIKDGRACYST